VNRLLIWLTAFVIASLHALEARAQVVSAAPTFARDVAPILFEHCAGCHQVDGSAPFSLITFQEVRPRAAAIVQAISSHSMPPWKPDRSAAFIGERLLSDREIDVLRRWEQNGARQGDPRQLPPAPRRPAGWQLGTPDLIVDLPEYVVPPGATDTFRNFVVPIGVTSTRYVRGLEFQPGNAVVHHANLFVDRTSASRRLDEADPESGYEGLIPFSAAFPEGHILAWTPGQVPPLAPKGLAWRLDAGTDLLVQLHVQPAATATKIRPRVGLFFTPEAPTIVPTVLRLGRQNIDIAPGDARYVATDSYVLPVDVEVEAVQPHAHARARSVVVRAELPDRSGRTIIAISDWDSHWQDLYRLAKPFWLPSGTRLVTEFVFDNSAANRRNPDRPPRHVSWGVRASDEMGHAWIQVLTRDARDRRTLAADFRPKQLAEDIEGYETRIRLRPDDPTLHDDVALMYLALGTPTSAIAHFEASLGLRPLMPAASNNLGTAFEAAGRLDDAAARYRQALAIDDDYVIAHNNLARVLTSVGRLDEAAEHYRVAVRLMPGNADAQNNLGNILFAQGRDAEARPFLERALQINASHPEAHFNLARLLARRGDDHAAIGHFRVALGVKKDWPACLASLAWILSTHAGRSGEERREAVMLATRAADLTGRQDSVVLDVLAAAYASVNRFGDAATTARAALERARAAGLTDLSAKVEKRLALYTSGTAYVE
jgi:tetratricopeptide (TPR) repeat protein/mono/diheme cytochrome c family protein